MTTRRRLRLILLDSDTEPVEALLGIQTTLWGLWLLNPWLHSFSTVGTFTALAQLAPEDAWGGTAVVLGLWLLIAALRMHVGLRRPACFGAAVLWAFIGAGCVTAAPSSTAVVNAATWTLAASWSYLVLSCWRRCK